MGEEESQKSTRIASTHLEKKINMNLGGVIYDKLINCEFRSVHHMDFMIKWREFRSAQQFYVQVV